MSDSTRTSKELCYEHEYPKGGMHVQVWRKSDCPFCKIERLQQICAAAYQLAGLVGAPVRFLDALALHDDVDVESLLPVRLDEFDDESDASPKAPWLTTAHLLCTDAGIPHGDINHRLLELRKMLEARRAPPPRAE